MIEQYLKVKAENQDSILLFRLGDFYEMFFDDARTASKELEIVLTARDGGCEKIPMCGVPYHSVNNYIARLINKGYKVAICDQVEDPKTAVGIVKREITKIITPGTIMDEAMLDEGKNNYLAAVVKQHDIIGLSCIDISTGDFWVTEFQGSDAEARLDNELQRLMPAECLLAFGDEMNSLWIDNPVNRSMFVSRVDEPLCTLPEARQKLQRHFGVSSLEGYGLKECSSSIIAAALIMDFLDHNYKSRLQHIQSISFHNTAGYMDLDSCTRKNLELTATIREGRKEGTLLGVLDHCRTPMGKRLLRKWLNEPLLDDKQINNRLDAVQELFSDLNLRKSCREFLGKISDLERLAGKLGSNTANPRDLLAIKNSAACSPK
jgi:DNA mismatch repair protein MutS